MGSEMNFVEFIVDQLEEAGTIRYRKMFGEFAIYCNEKIVGLICDNQFFVKPTAAGREFIGEERLEEQSPYPGAKPYYLIADQVEDRDWLSELVQISEKELPLPRAKKPKEKKKA